MKITANQLKTNFGVESVEAANLLKGLTAFKKAELVGKAEKGIGQRGRAANVYYIPAETARFLGYAETAEVTIEAVEA
jgi:hypothetical protein